MTRKSIRGNLQLVVLLASALVYAPFVLAQSSADEVEQHKQLGQVDRFTGGFQTSIPFDVPPFHGVEPAVGIGYSSNATNGFAGMGWSLAGPSVIQRAGPGQGAPRYDDDDIFLLDGQELVECDGGMTSPSCTSCPAGLTCYVSKLESYQRIAHDDAANTWHVWQKNGTEAVYQRLNFTGSVPVEDCPTEQRTYTCGITHCGWCPSACACPEGGTLVTTWCQNGPCCGKECNKNKKTRKITCDVPVCTISWDPAGAIDYRWGLSTVTDTLGNQAAYTWSMDGNNDAYLDEISYGPFTVNLYVEARPDPLMFSTGAGQGTSFYRLKTVLVQADGANVHAYDVQYEESGVSQTSRLSTVVEYGKDVSLDGNGAVTGGTSMPAGAMSYFAESAGSFGASVTNGHGTTPGSGYTMHSPDLNGDGKADVCITRPDGWYTYCSLSNGDGTFAAPVYTNNGGSSTNAWSTFVTDLDGDGMDDLCRSRCASSGGEWFLSCQRSDGTGGFEASVSSQPHNNACVGGRSNVSGDFNGDGKGDVCITRGNGTYNWDSYCALGNGDGTFQAAVKWASAVSVLGVDLTVDMNDDGKTDFCKAAPSGSSSGAWKTHCALSQGDGLFGAVSTADHGITLGTDSARMMIDISGDQTPDACAIRTNAGLEVYCAVSNGDGSFLAAVSQSYSISGVASSNWAKLPVDINRDGKRDICISRGDAAGWTSHCVVSNGDGSFGDPVTFSHGDSTSSSWTPKAMDANGDSKQDLCLSYPQATGGWTTKCALTDGVFDHAMSQMTNGIGGTMSVTYTPSSAWDSTYLPTGVVFPTASATTLDDGRGWSATSSFEYSGALWDDLDRRFLGFRYVKTTTPCLASESQCPYGETWFRQDYGSVSKPERDDAYDGDGTLMTSTVREYTTNGSTIPYTSNETGVWGYGYDGSGNECSSWPCTYGKRTYASRTFDEYGNLVQDIGYGDYDEAGDERTHVHGYVPNTTAFITGKPAYNRLYEGAGTGGALLGESLTYYDGNTDWNAAPHACGTAPCGGLVTKTARLTDTTGQYQEVSQEYDAVGNLLAEVDALGNRTEYLMDSTYNLFRVETRNPLHTTGADLRHRYTATFDLECGAPLTETDVNGLTTTYTYDVLCRRTRVDTAEGGFREQSFSAFGDPNAQYVEGTGPGVGDGTGDAWRRTYFDGLGRTYKLVSKGPSPGTDIIAEVEYNARGAKSRQSVPYYTGDPVYWESYDYDGGNRLVQTTHPDQTISSRTYGLLGEVTTVDALGHQKTKTLDGLGRTIRLREWLDGQAIDTNFEYNVRGQLTKVIDAEGNEWEMTYNTLGQKTSVSDPDRGLMQFEYDLLARVTARIDALGNRVEFSYDALSRKTEEIHRRDDSSVEATHTFIYDEDRTGYYNVGKMTTVVDEAGSQTMDFDAGRQLARSTRTIDGQPYTVEHGFDTAGRPLWTTFPDGDSYGTPANPRTYDGAGRPKSSPGYVDDTIYNAAGQATTLTFANGVVTTAQYDPEVGTLTSLNTVSGGTAIQDSTYAYDALGRIIDVTSTFAGNGWSFDYDDLGRVIDAINHDDPADNQDWQYDNVGNMTNNSRVGSYVYDSAHGPGSVRPHAVAQAGANTYAYNARGEMTSGAGRTMTWNVAGLPLSVGDSTFVYDAFGARIKKTEGGVMTLYLGPDYEIQGGQTTKYFDHGGQLVAKKQGSGKFWLHTNHQGSIEAVTDASGNEVQRQTYRPYGDRLATGTSHVESRGFVGQRQDDTGLLYLNARYYDPVLGRFISADPQVPTDTSEGLNRYSYAGNDPVNRTDASGLFFGKVFKAIGSLVKGLGDIVKGVGDYLGGLAKSIKSGQFFTDFKNGIKYYFKALASGDWKAWASLAVTVAAMYGTTVLLSQALHPMANSAMLAAGAPHGAAAFVTATASVPTLASIAGAAGWAAFVGINAAVGFATGFATGMIHTGSPSLAFNAAIRGGVGGGFNAALKLGLYEANWTIKVFGVEINTREDIAGNAGADQDSAKYQIRSELPQQPLGWNDFVDSFNDSLGVGGGYLNTPATSAPFIHAHDALTGLQQELFGERPMLNSVVALFTGIAIVGGGEAALTQTLRDTVGDGNGYGSAIMGPLGGTTAVFAIPDKWIKFRHPITGEVVFKVNPRHEAFKFNNG